MVGEFLSHPEIAVRAEEIRMALNSLKVQKSLVGKPSAEQWRFFNACGERLLSPGKPSEFDQISSSRSAQLKFEVEDKLRRYYNHPGKFVDYVFSLVHKGKLPGKRVSYPEYPNLAGYCLLVRAVREDYVAREDKSADTRPLIERVVSGCVDAEFAAYAALPEIKTDEINRWFCIDGPAYREIMNLLVRHKARGWTLSNNLNPSTKRLIDIRVKTVDAEEAIVHTTEYWYLRWWDTKKLSYVYPYRETNRQTYIVKQENGTWKVFQNLRPSPRSSAPNRRTKTGFPKG
ncbi:MAG: hypothetical protein C4529_11270 [Deltaproteobacteria bacterium]|nr:MAG: hypothetical protein C4529_11270 [Deltaproteobacteria bacterium]